ncbi:MAG: response regulator transcription factor [Thermoanaerobaculia bacterium]
MPEAERPRAIAVVDDEPHIREMVAFALRREGYRVAEHADGQEAWQAFQESLPDLVILDILMPRLDGLELCRRLRGSSQRLPIVFLTSKDEELDRVLGLELGADDYLCKPFSVRELVARVRVLLRRLAMLEKPEEHAGEPSRLLERGPLALDLDRYTALWDGRPVPLTVTEFMLLKALATRPGHVRTRRQLMEEGYPQDAYVSERTIDSHIKRLRRKFLELTPGFDAIQTVHGLGYRYREAGGDEP